METFKHILVATDFGEPAGRALDFAIALASQFQSRLTVLHSSWLPAAAYAASAEVLYWPNDEMAKEAEKELAKALAKAEGRCPEVDGIVVIGDPWRTILDVAKRRDVDLIVMGTHGRHGLSRVFLGSVAERVVRFSPIPVLTISAKDDREAKDRILAQASDAS